MEEILLEKLGMGIHVMLMSIALTNVRTIKTSF